MGDRNLNKDKTRHIDYSKVMCGLITALIAAILIFGCVMIGITQDTSALTELIIGGFAALTLVSAAYLWRAKAKDKIQMYRDDPEAFVAAGIGDDENEEAGG